MENENKEKVILTDEELKEVNGGVNIKNIIRFCTKTVNMHTCITSEYCAWINRECVPDPKKYKY